jgi:hypothetical protein
LPHPDATAPGAARALRHPVCSPDRKRGAAALALLARPQLLRPGAMIALVIGTAARPTLVVALAAAG